MAKLSRSLTVLALAVLAALALTACSSGSKSADPTSTAGGPSGPPSTPGAQKPCVARVDPLPAGAPDVAVKVGPAPTELVIEDLTPGTGTEVMASSSVTVDYIGVACSTGKIFDSSYSRGETATFPLGGVIPGWSKGLLGMKAGGIRLLGIPSNLAYGPSGQGADIGPNEALWFVVDVKSVS